MTIVVSTEATRSVAKRRDLAGRGQGPSAPLRFGRGDVMALLLALLLSLVANLALAVEPSEILPDPALERRARDIGRQLRCVVCQNQSIDDSSAEVARDMRRAVRERLTQGYNDAQVFDYMVARYGDYVLLNPPFKAETWALWLGGPLVLLLAGGTLLLAARRRARVPLAPPPLTTHERQRLAEVLKANSVAPSEAERSRGALPDADKVSPLRHASRGSGRDDK